MFLGRGSDSWFCIGLILVVCLIVIVGFDLVYCRLVSVRFSCVAEVCLILFRLLVMIGFVFVVF